MTPQEKLIWNVAIKAAAESAKAKIISVPENINGKIVYYRACVVIKESILKLIK